MSPAASSGFTVFFTGLPASGKTTLAGALCRRLEQCADRQIALLDGDVVRRGPSADLGYSRADREAHIRRVGQMAADITCAGGIALCALIAPYDASRREARALIEREGGFVLVYLSTPLAVCESRDPKGLYAKARAGVISDFTGVSAPYEIPRHADVAIDTSVLSIDQAAERLVQYLREHGLVD